MSAFFGYFFFLPDENVRLRGSEFGIFALAHFLVPHDSRHVVGYLCFAVSLLLLAIWCAMRTRSDNEWAVLQYQLENDDGTKAKVEHKIVIIPDQSPDPTRTSGTPPAGHESRHP